MARLLASLLLVALVGVASPPAGAAGDPAVQQPIDALHAALLETMKAGSSLSFADREKKLDPVVRAAFDLSYMAEVATGQYWKEMTDAQRSQFVAAFSEMSVATYASRFKDFGGEAFQDLGQDKGPRDTVWQRSQLNIPNKDAISLNYLMHKTGPTEWKAIDVYLAGSVSEMVTRRAEYTSVLRSQGVEGLIAALQSKAKQLRGS
jgi:phospholipid transport system substrate-binding protein